MDVLVFVSAVPAARKRAVLWMSKSVEQRGCHLGVAGLPFGR
jgi:hypothetical protein